MLWFTQIMYNNLYTVFLRIRAAAPIILTLRVSCAAVIRVWRLFKRLIPQRQNYFMSIFHGLQAFITASCIFFCGVSTTLHSMSIPCLLLNVPKIWQRMHFALVCAFFRGRHGGLMVSALVSRSSPGRGHCVVFLSKTRYSHSDSLHPSV